ncbi:MAG: gamma-glutamylcyclotransferase [Chloroflexota bacterium]
MSDAPEAFFVYGTLKRGQANHGLIATYARSIVVAWAPGTLYSISAFPMLVEGSGLVKGELVQINQGEMERVLPLVDGLEEYWPERPEDSLYCRRIVDVTTEHGTRESAFSYYFNDTCAEAATLGAPARVKSGDWTGSV